VIAPTLWHFADQRVQFWKSFSLNKIRNPSPSRHLVSVPFGTDSIEGPAQTGQLLRMGKTVEGDSDRHNLTVLGRSSTSSGQELLAECHLPTGSVKKNSEPTPGRLSTWMWPPCSSTMVWAMARPSPVLRSPAVLRALVRPKG
jgi:hypothetical protein